MIFKIQTPRELLISQTTFRQASSRLQPDRKIWGKIVEGAWFTADCMILKFILTHVHAQLTHLWLYLAVAGAERSCHEPAGGHPGVHQPLVCLLLILRLFSPRGRRAMATQGFAILFCVGVVRGGRCPSH